MLKPYDKLIEQKVRASKYRATFIAGLYRAGLIALFVVTNHTFGDWITGAAANGNYRFDRENNS